MKQTVEEAARDYMKSEINDWHDAIYIEGQAPALERSIPQAFKAGVEWHSKQSPWISVEDKLPEEKQPVLVANYFKSARKPYYEYYMGFYRDGEWCACTCVDENGEDYILTDVTHWMPIPELPKGGAE